LTSWASQGSSRICSKWASRPGSFKARSLSSSSFIGLLRRGLERRLKHDDGDPRSPGPSASRPSPATSTPEPSPSTPSPTSSGWPPSADSDPPSPSNRSTPSPTIAASSTTSHPTPSTPDTSTTSHAPTKTTSAHPPTSATKTRFLTARKPRFLTAANKHPPAAGPAASGMAHRYRWPLAGGRRCRG